MFSTFVSFLKHQHLHAVCAIYMSEQVKLFCVPPKSQNPFETMRLHSPVLPVRTNHITYDL